MRTRENPFAPPRSDFSSKRVERGSAVIAVLAGVAADVGGALIAGVLLVAALNLILTLQGMSSERIREVFTHNELGSLVSILWYAMGSTFSVVGGYVCARVARHCEYKLAGIVAAIVLALGWLIGSVRTPPVLHAGLSVLTIVFVIGGAWLGAARNRFRT